MSPKRNWLFRFLVSAVAVLGAAIGWSSPSHAFIQQFVVDQTATVNLSPIPLGSSVAGSPVSYTIYQGRIFGNLNPNSTLNSIITDITLAPKTGGYATYIANFQIVTPTDPAARSGLLINEVSNRGGNAISLTALIAGATYVQSGWQGDLLSECSLTVAAPYPCFDLNSGPYGTLNTTTGAFTAPSVAGKITGTTSLTAYVIQVPVATTDGNAPNGTNTITGPVYSHVAPGTSGPTAQLIIGNAPSVGGAFTPYQPVSLDTFQAQLWSETSQTLGGVNTNQTSISSANWSWAYCPSGPPGTPNPTWICLNSGTFDATKLYETVFTAANPLVLGVGYAATRDFISFLHYGTTAPGGGANPIAGSVSKTINIGSSQSGAFVRGSIFYGFNEDEGGRIVFDGAWPKIDGRMLWLNQRWAQPTVLLQLYMGGDEAPVWWSDFPNQARGLPADGLLHRCTATGTCPQVIEYFGELEFYGEKIAPDLTGFCVSCTTDIPLPSNVYRYYLPGTTHGGGGGGFTWAAPGTLSVTGGSTYPANPNPESQTANALQADFFQFIMNGTAMPPSAPGVTYPSLASGQLVPNTATAVGFPTNIPNLTYAGNMAWPPIVYDFGPGVNYDLENGTPTVQPPTVQQVLTEYVPIVNSDGNDKVGSVPSVLFQVPLGTYLGWNPVAAGSPYSGQQNSLNGGYWPFWDTIAHRTTAGDPRLSLEERYGTHGGYVCLERIAAAKAVAQRFLLATDATTLNSQAAASNVLSPFTATVADTSLANTLCGRTQTHDLDGSGTSDILWRDTSGDVAAWLVTGGAVTSSALVGTVPTSWSIAGQRDFNGDGMSDILWHDSSGNVAIWLMNGTSVSSSAFVGNVATNWSIVGTGDFNNDGKGDILWRSSTGDIAIWMMNGATLSSGVFVGNLPTTWSVAGSNGNTIVWRDSSGNVAVWKMNGGTISSSVSLGNVPTSWAVAGTGDFDGDGNTDILWRDSSGNVAIWLLKADGSFASSAFVGTVPVTWTVAQTGDYNNDGKSDILWTDTTGDVAIWEMSGGSVISALSVGNIPVAWAVQGAGAD